MTSTEISGYLAKEKPMTHKCTLGQSSHSQGKGKPSLLPHDWQYLQIRSPLAALQEATGKREASSLASLNLKSNGYAMILVHKPIEHDTRQTFNS